MSSQTNPLSTVLTEITDAELNLLKGPLLDFSKALQAPGANFSACRTKSPILVSTPAAFRTGPDHRPEHCGRDSGSVDQQPSRDSGCSYPQPAPAPLVTSANGSSVA